MRLAVWMLRVGSFSVIALTTRAAGAQEPEPLAGEEVVVITAGRGEETALEASRAVSTVDARRGYERIVATAPELLAEAPGVFLKRTNDSIGAPIVRGLLGNRVLVLLDGIRLNTAITRSGRNPGLNLIDPFTIDRIEVVRGAGSVLYGSDAIGGVVQVLERRPSLGAEGLQLSPEAIVRGGSASSSFQGRAALGASQATRGMLVGGGGSRFGQMSAGGDLGTQQFTGGTAYSADGKGSQLVGPMLLSAEVSTVRYVDAPRGDSTPEDQSWFTEQSRTGAVVRAVGGWAALPVLETHVSFQRQAEDRRRLRVDPERRADETDIISGIGTGVQADVLQNDIATIRTGVDFLHERLSSRASDIDPALGTATPRPRARYVDGAWYQTVGVFAQSELRLADWLTVTPGGRGSFIWASAPVDSLRPTSPGLSFSDQSLVGSLLAKVRLAENVRLLGSLSQAFRAPNLDDLLAYGSSARAFDAPVTSLSSERSIAGDLGVRLNSAYVSGEVFGFYTRLSDLIARRPGTFDGAAMVDGKPVFVRENADRGEIGGFEGAVRARLRPVQLTATALWARGVQRTVNDVGQPISEPLSRIPPLAGSASLRYEPGWRGVYAEAGLSWAARQDRLSAEDRADLRICPLGPDTCRGTPGYGVVSLRSGAEIARQVRASIVVENLANAPYRNHSSDLYAPGRSVLASLEVRDSYPW